jgi:hypothetical protein
MDFIKTNKGVMLSTILISISCFAMYRISGKLDTIGMAAIILNWLPLLIGVFTLIFYFITTIFSKKHAWIVALIGNIFNLLMLVSVLIN